MENNNKNNVNISEVNFNELVQKLSDFFKLKKISKSDFCENPQIYLDINDFYELFKKIKFELSKAETHFLFQYKNANLDEGYILIQIFVENFSNCWFDNTNENKEDVKEITSLLKINNEFKSLQDEVMKVMKKLI